MLFRFLGLAFLEYCLFSLVCASPMKEYLKIVEDASSSSSLPKGRPSRFSPYQKHPNPISGTFRCPNGQAIDEKKIRKLRFGLPKISLHELNSENFKAEKLSFDDRYDTFRYQINSDGSLVQQLASKDLSTGYELDMNQAKYQPFTWYFGGVYFKSGTGRQYCPYTLQRVNPFDSSIFEEQGRKVFDCNGVFFQPDHVQKSMLDAKKALHERLVELRLAIHPKAKKGSPIPFESGIFTVEDTWMFPIFPRTNSVYKHGNSGIYWVVTTSIGEPVGIVYSKTPKQCSEETKRNLVWTTSPTVHKYGICEVKDVM